MRLLSDQGFEFAAALGNFEAGGGTMVIQIDAAGLEGELLCDTNFPGCVALHRRSDDKLGNSGPVRKTGD